MVSHAIMLKLFELPHTTMASIRGKLCTGTDCDENTAHHVLSNTTVQADQNQSSWINNILTHFDSELAASPHTIDSTGGHEPVTLFLDSKASTKVSNGKVSNPLACLVVPHADGGHGWHIYHLLGLDDTKAPNAFKELTGNVADLAQGAEVEGDANVPVQAQLGASFGDTIKKVGSGIFKFLTHTVSGGLSNVLGSVIGGLL